MVGWSWTTNIRHCTFGNVSFQGRHVEKNISCMECYSNNNNQNTAQMHLPASQQPQPWNRNENISWWYHLQFCFYFFVWYCNTIERRIYLAFRKYIRCMSIRVSHFRRRMGRVAYIFYDALDQISRFWIPTDRCWIWMITGHPKKHSTKWIARRECMMHTNAIPTPMHLHILVLVCLACTLHNETHTHTSLLIHTSSLAVRTHSSTSRNAVRYNEGPYVCLTHAHTPCGANQRYHYGNSNFIVLHSDAHAFDGITVCFWMHNWWSANNKLIHQGE